MKKKQKKDTLSTPLNVSDNMESVDSPSNKLSYKTLIVHGTKYRTLYTKKYESRNKWQQKNDKHILSFIPGTVLELFVKNGEKVQENQPLLVLEAMKMENTIFAPFSGTVKAVNIKLGDRVPKDTLMIEFE